MTRRLVQVGVGNVFAVPGDFNLTLLVHLIASQGCASLAAATSSTRGTRGHRRRPQRQRWRLQREPARHLHPRRAPTASSTTPSASRTFPRSFAASRLSLASIIHCLFLILALVTNLDDAHEQIDTAEGEQDGVPRHPRATSPSAVTQLSSSSLPG